MATKSGIASAITSKVGSTAYDIWRIGLTHDPVERKKYWASVESTSYWSQWQADSLSNAQDIESFFINKGMKGGTGGDLSSWRTTYVYFFKLTCWPPLALPLNLLGSPPNPSRILF
jgi:hypothetical protein